MPKLSEEKLQQYRRLADKGLFDSHDPKINAFNKRTLAESRVTRTGVTRQTHWNT